MSNLAETSNTTAATPAAPYASTPESVSPVPPSTHVRILITWLAIFPLVAIGLYALGPISMSWSPLLRALVLTVLVVPVAGYLVMPGLLALYGALRRRRRTRR